MALIDLEQDEEAWVEGISTLAEAMNRRGQDAEAFPLIAYGPHGDAQTLRKARALGCDAVLTKRDFSQQLPELLRTRGQAVIFP